MKEFVEAKGVVSISGDYCAWHEASISVEWVYGKHFYYEDMVGEAICDALDCDYDEIEKQDKAIMDEIAQEYAKNFKGDYTDVDNGSVLLEIENGKVIKVWQ